MSERQKAIGVFDSGVGGLTVVAEIQRLLPGEDIIYLGDTARLPYGNKSPETIIRYAAEDAGFLLRREVKAVVVACNTATAHALPSLQARFSLPVLGVIDPGVHAALEATKTGRIGIIGTVGTIGSGAYQQALLAADPKLRLTAIPTPLLVPLIEEDWIDHAATHLIIGEYLTPILSAHVDTLVLACTHYPLVHGIMRTILSDDVRLVDSAENMAIELQRCLREKDLLQPSAGHIGEVRVHVTDLSPRFSSLVKRFLRGFSGEIEKVNVEE